MAICELCGTEKPLLRCRIEATVMSVCDKCARFGDVLKLPEQKKQIVKAKQEVIIETIVSDYAAKVRNARARSGLSQEDFAKKISEKESVVHKLETGAHEPSIDLARKLEKMLHITLVEQLVETPVEQQKKSSSKLTIGDLIKIK